MEIIQKDANFVTIRRTDVTPKFYLTLQKRVAKGIAWLDKYDPTWWRKIKLNKLNMNDTCKCVLGQCFASNSRDDGFYFIVDSRNAKYRPGIPSLNHKIATAYGFNLNGEDETGVDHVESSDGEQAPGWSALGDLWIAAVKQRKQAMLPKRNVMGRFLKKTRG